MAGVAEFTTILRLDDKMSGPAGRAAAGLDAKLSPSLARTTKHLKAMGAGLLVAGGLIVGALGGMTKSAADFQKEIASVATLGVKDLGTIEKTVKDVSMAFGLDLSDAAKAAYQAISAGASEVKLPLILEASAKAATAGMTDLTTAIDLGMGTMNAFGGELKSVNEVFDLAFIAVKSGVTTFEELGASVGKISPLFKAAGLGADEMFASISALTKGGIATAEAVTGIKGAITGIVKPTADMQKAFEDVGGPMAALQKLGLIGFLDAVKEKTGGNLAEMGKLFGSTEALGAVLALTGAAAGDFTAILAEMQSATGATDVAFQRFMDANPAFAFEQLKATMAVLSVEIGQALLPHLIELARTITPIIKSTIDWIQANPGLTKTIASVAAATGLLMLAIGPLLLVLPGLAIAFGGGAGIGAAAGVAGIAVTGLAVALGPLVLGAAIIGTGALVFNLIGNLSKLHDANLKLADAEGELSFQVEQSIAALEKEGIAVDRSTLAGKTKAQQLAILLKKMLRVVDAQDASAGAATTEASATKISGEASQIASGQVGRLATAAEWAADALGGATKSLGDTKTSTDLFREALEAAQGPQSDSIWAFRAMAGGADGAADAVERLINQLNNLKSAQGGGFASGGIVPRKLGGMVPFFDVQKLARGGRVRPTLALVGEEGPELRADLGGSHITPARATEEIFQAVASRMSTALSGPRFSAASQAGGGGGGAVTGARTQTIILNIEEGAIVVQGSDDPQQTAVEIVDLIQVEMADRLEDSMVTF